jgi:hypothetical protein
VQAEFMGKPAPIRTPDAATTEVQLQFLRIRVGQAGIDVGDARQLWPVSRA